MSLLQMIARIGLAFAGFFFLTIALIIGIKASVKSISRERYVIRGRHGILLDLIGRPAKFAGFTTLIFAIVLLVCTIFFMSILLFIVVYDIFLYWVYGFDPHFLSIDSCLDSGGSWDYVRLVCSVK